MGKKLEDTILYSYILWTRIPSISMMKFSTQEYSNFKYEILNTGDTLISNMKLSTQYYSNFNDEILNTDVTPISNMKFSLAVSVFAIATPN